MPNTALRGCFELLEGRIGEVNGGPVPDVKTYPYEFARSIIFGELRKAVQTLFVDMDDPEKATRDNRIKGDECAKKDALDERDRDLKGKWMTHHVDGALKTVKGRWTELPQRAYPSSAYVVKLASQVTKVSTNLLYSKKSE